MLEYDRAVYLDVYRTGSSHLAALLPELCGGPPVRAFRHASLTKGRPIGIVPGKLVFTTVRNPWDWYVSLWAHGTGGKSAIRRHLAARLGASEVDALYDRAAPAASFRRWLRTIQDPATLERTMREHLPESGLASVIGLYTYRFLRVTTRFPRLLLRRPWIRQARDARRHHRWFKAYEVALRTESLDDDLAALIAAHPDSFHPDAARRLRATSAQRTNASVRALASYRDYYTDADAALVADRDRFFVDEFGYRF